MEHCRFFSLIGDISFSEIKTQIIYFFSLAFSYLLDISWGYLISIIQKRNKEK